MPPSISSRRRCSGLSAVRQLQLFLAFKGRHLEFRAQGGLRDGYGHGAVEVVPSPLEERVLADPEYDVEVAGRSAVDASLALSAHAQARPFFYSWRNLQRQDLLLADPAFAPAVRTILPDHLARSSALRARPADGEKALLVPDLPAASARRAGEGRAALLGARAAASRTGLRARNLDLGLEAEGGFLKGNLQVIAQVRAALRARAPRLPTAENVAEAEEIAEDVFEIRKDTGVGLEAARAADAGVAKAVVSGALLLIGQHAVGFRDFFELLGRLLRALRIAVGMVLEREFPVGALDLLLGGAPSHAQHFVVVSLTVHFDFGFWIFDFGFLILV